MVKEYMVVKNGVSKKTGKPYSIAKRMQIANDGSWANLDDKDSFFTDDIRPLGEVLKVEQMEV